MEKRKKRLIILSIIAGVLVLTILLSSAVFRIKSVSVEYQTTLTLLSKTDLDKMVADENMPIGKSIFFTSMKKTMAELEQKNPYIKVNGIERKFPNSIVVLVSERVPVVKVETGNGTYILDSELKVLNIASSTGEFNAITGENDLPKLVVDDEFNNSLKTLNEGEFLADEKIRNYVDAFYRGAVAPSSDDAEVATSLINTLEEIKVGFDESLDRAKFEIKYSGTSLKSTIIGDNDLTENIYKVITTATSSEDFAEVNCTDGVVYVKKR